MPQSPTKPHLTRVHVMADETTLRVIRQVNKQMFGGIRGPSAAIRFLAKHYLLARRSLGTTSGPK